MNIWRCSNQAPAHNSETNWNRMRWATKKQIDKKNDIFYFQICFFEFIQFMSFCFDFFFQKTDKNVIWEGFFWLNTFSVIDEFNFNRHVNKESRKATLSTKKEAFKIAYFISKLFFSGNCCWLFLFTVG